MAKILITTDYLHSGDDVDSYLRSQGHEVVYSPVSSHASRQASLFEGIDGAIIASEPVTAEMLR